MGTVRLTILSMPPPASCLYLTRAISVLAAVLEALGPDRAGRGPQVGRGRGIDRKGSGPVHLHDLEHWLAVQREPVKRADVRRVLGAGQVALTVHDRR